jgi:hypothetical protein
MAGSLNSNKKKHAIIATSRVESKRDYSVHVHKPLDNIQPHHTIEGKAPMYRSLFTFCITALVAFSHPSLASSLRCGSQLVDLGNTKAEVTSLCGSPVMTDSYCKPVTRKSMDSHGHEHITESCEDIDVWSYNQGTGTFWRHVYFAQGKVIEIQSGERVR